MFSRLLRLTVPPFAAFATLDAAKVAIQALLLSRIRAQHPELFDGKLAAEQIRLALQEATVNPSR